MTSGSLFVYDWSCTEDNDTTTIRIFGLDERNRTVCVTVTDFLPHFYVELPMDRQWNKPSLLMIGRGLDYTFRESEWITRRVCTRRKLYYAEPADQKHLFIHYQFPTAKHFRQVAGYLRYNAVKVIGAKPVKVKVHEHNASPVLQLMCEADIDASGWMNFHKGEPISETHAHAEYKVSFKHLSRGRSDAFPQPTIMSFDIEVYSANPNVMPNPQNMSDCVFQIACVTWVPGQPVTKVLLSLGDPDPKIVGADVEVRTFKNESRLLLGFTALIREHNPNVLTGYNILGFDMPYLLDRADTLRVRSSFAQCCMVRDRYALVVEESWASAAYGNQEFRYLDTYGRVYIDLLAVARREYKFSSYKLNNVAAHFLSAEKDPLTAKDIFRGYELGMQGDRGALAEVGKYCVQDSVLVQRLFDIMQVWVGVAEMAKVCSVPLSYLYTKGQQIKVFSQVYRYCHSQGIVVESDGYVADASEQYKGATVKQPKAGMYEYVLPFDFKSLYPTVIIAYNIDYSTLVRDDSIPDHKCHVIEWEEHVDCKHTFAPNIASKEYVCASHRYRFVKEPKGVLPTIIQNLLDTRASTRAEIKRLRKQLAPGLSEDERRSVEQKCEILNKRQLSYKVSANSMYGALGVRRGYLPCLPIAMSVTAMGRANLERAVHHLESCHRAVNIYSDTDSCYVRFPHIRDPGQLWTHARKIEREIDKAGIFPAPMYLEFENAVYGKFLILSKKRYMWQDYTEEGVLLPKIGQKGVMSARRDNSGFARSLYKETTQHIFDGAGLENTLAHILARLDECCSGSIGFREFVISKSIRSKEEYAIRELSADPAKREKRLAHLQCDESGYAGRALPAHVQLAERMRARGIRVDAGQRVEYLMTTTGGHNGLQCDKVEDPEYQQRFAAYVRIDYLYYIHAVISPLDQLLEIAFAKDLELDPRRVLSEPTKKSKRIRASIIDPVRARTTGLVKSQYKLRVAKHKLGEFLTRLFAPTIVLEKTETNQSEPSTNK